MADAEKVLLAKDLAEHLAGQEVRYSVDELTGMFTIEPTTRQGLIVGHVPFRGDVMLTSTSSQAFRLEDLPPATVVWTWPPDPKARYQWASAYDVVAKPLYPKKPLINRFPHKCRRCKGPALELFRTVDCSNWRCALYYLR